MLRITWIACFAGMLAMPLMGQPLTIVTAQPPLAGIITIVQPRGQFYINIGSVDQVYTGATISIDREGRTIGMAKLIKVNRLDAIGQLLPQYQGIRVQAGDYALVTANPVSATPPRGMPYIEPDASMREEETLYSLFYFFVLGSILAND